jgi:hypothetical protein
MLVEPFFNAAGLVFLWVMLRLLNFWCVDYSDTAEFDFYSWRQIFCGHSAGLHVVDRIFANGQDDGSVGEVAKGHAV